MGKARFAIGAIVGAVAGVIAGLLTAPKSGKQTRADLKEKADELKRGAGGKMEGTRRRGEKMTHEIKERVDDYRDRGERAKRAAEKELKSKKQ